MNVLGVVAMDIITPTSRMAHVSLDGIMDVLRMALPWWYMSTCPCPYPRVRGNPMYRNLVMVVTIRIRRTYGGHTAQSPCVPKSLTGTDRYSCLFYCQVHLGHEGPVQGADRFIELLKFQ